MRMRERQGAGPVTKEGMMVDMLNVTDADLATIAMATNGQRESIVRILTNAVDTIGCGMEREIVTADLRVEKSYSGKPVVVLLVAVEKPNCQSLRDARIYSIGVRGAVESHKC